MIFRIIILCLICVSVAQQAVSQVAVTPSTTIEVIEGKRFYRHTVQQGETMFSISRAYNVSQQDILLHNPDAVEVLSIGQELKIPVPIVYEIHTVNRGETVFSISRLYNANINEILEVNPEIEQNEFRLSIGQQIKIPTIPLILPVTTTEVQQTEFVDPTNEFRIAFLLPLFLDDTFPESAPDPSMERDSEGRYRSRDGRFWIHQRSANALEFYQGALLALDTLREQGLNAQITVFDTMNDAERMAQILRSPEMSNTDLIIGPFTTGLVNQVADFARENEVHYVSPIAINVESMRNNPYLIQVNSGEINTVNPIVDFIATKENIHVTLIGNRAEADQTLFNAYRNRLRTVFDDNVLTVLQMRPDSLVQANRYLRGGLLNIVIIPAASEAFVNRITGQLRAASSNFQINLYGLEGWTKFVNLDLEYLYTLEFRYATAFFIDYDNPEVRNFLNKFRNMYHTEPTMLIGFDRISPLSYQFAFLGYDITYFFVSALKKYGRNFGNNLSDFRLNLIQSDFRFERIDPDSGFRNTNFKIYRYTRDYSIVRETVGD